MNIIIVLFLPSVLGIKMFMNFNKNRKILDIIIYYLLLVLFSNFINMIIFSFINREIYNLIEYLETNYLFSLTYITVLLIVNTILSIIFTIIIKYFDFTIEVENGRKKSKSKSIKEH